MRALTLWQPWASLIASGAKTIETRSWRPPEKVIGTRIAIHASTRPWRRSVGNRTLNPIATFHGLVLGKRWQSRELSTNFSEVGRRFDALPGGVVLGTVFLDRAVCVEHNDGAVAWCGTEASEIDPFGDFGAGRWLWHLRDFEAFNPPIRASGSHRFWEWER